MLSFIRVNTHLQTSRLGGAGCSYHQGSPRHGWPWRQRLQTPPDIGMYKGADKSLAQPGRKQAVATEDFDFRIPCF